jgi:hypothetical protein
MTKAMMCTAVGPELMPSQLIEAESTNLRELCIDWGIENMAMIDDEWLIKPFTAVGDRVGRMPMFMLTKMCGDAMTDMAMTNAEERIEDGATKRLEVAEGINRPKLGSMDATTIGTAADVVNHTPTIMLDTVSVGRPSTWSRGPSMRGTPSACDATKQSVAQVRRGARPCQESNSSRD